MDKRSFYDNQLVENADLNTAFDNAEAADKLLAREGIGYGITAGFEVIAIGGQMKIGVNSGRIIDKDGQACAFAGLFQQTITTDTAGTPVAVGVGQERWVTVFAKVGRSLQGYAFDPSGGVLDNTNYTQQPAIINPHGDVVGGTQELYVVAGPPAAIGTAERPDPDAHAILLCDLYVGYGQTDFTGEGIIDCRRAELFRKVEPDLTGRMTENKSDYTLLFQWRRGTNITRMYLGRNGALAFTINAEWILAQAPNMEPLWKADNYANESLLWSLGGAGFGGTGTPHLGVFKVLSIGAGTRSTPWSATDWDVVATLGT